MSDLHSKTLKDLGERIASEWNPGPETRVYAYLRTLLRVERLSDYCIQHGGMSGGEAVNGFLLYSQAWQGGDAAAIKEELARRLQVQAWPAPAAPLAAGRRDSPAVNGGDMPDATARTAGTASR